MSNTIFLGRAEEQQQFRRFLRSLQPNWIQRNFPVFSKPFCRATDTRDTQPFLMLFHGEGGMGKTTLIHQLRKIVKEEKSLKDNFQVLLLDWEDWKTRVSGLQVGHDNIQPETVLDVLHDALEAEQWGSYLETYRKQSKQVHEIEAKVEKNLRSQQDNKLSEISKLGAKGIALIFRQSGIQVPAESIEKTIKVSAEGLHQARQFVNQILTQKEYEIYAQPTHQLAATALGKDIAALAQRQSLVIFLDTYEIVDRPECDYTLRTVIRHSGKRVLWVIAGRANLADTQRRSQDVFWGYKDRFAGDQFYATALSEFSTSEIQDYFAAVIPGQTLTEAEATDLKQFSLGIPFVISEAAAMWREGKAIAEIVVPTPMQQGKSPYRHIIDVTSARFLKHCFNDHDLRAVYALAMIHAPKTELLKEMIDVPDVEQTLQSLKQRYSFIWTEGRLDEKLADFIRDYLLDEVRRTKTIVQEANNHALTWLELCLGEQCLNIAETAERWQDEQITDTIIHQVNHAFWRSENDGWKSLVPWFVEGWQYNRRCTRGLLTIAERFSSTFTQAGQRRLRLMTNAISTDPDLDDLKRLLDELDLLAQRQWLAGDSYGERQTILRFQKARIAHRQESHHAALQAYLEVERQLPAQAKQLKKDLADALYSLSGALIWSKSSTNPVHSPEADAAIRAAISLNGETSDYHCRLGALLYAMGDYEQSVVVCQAAIQCDRNNAYAYYALGNALKAHGKLEEAITEYRQAIRINPDDAKAYNNLGNALQDHGKLEEAITEYRQAIRLNPDDATAYYNLGIALQDHGKLEEAITEYRQAIRLNPDDAKAYNNLGIALKDHGKLEEAITEYRQAIRLNPDDAKAYYNLGIALQDHGKLEEAITEYRQAIRLNPDDAKAYYNLGNALQAHGKLEEAITEYRQAIRLNPDDATAYNNLGIALQDHGKLEEAITEYRQAIRLNPDYATAYNNLGIALKAHGKLEEAITEYRQAIRINPDDATAYNNLGIALKAHGKLEEAITEYRQAIRINPDDAKAYNNLGNALQDHGKLEEAITEYRQAIRLNPDDATAYYNLGIALQDHGKLEEAITEYRQAIRLNPDDAKAYYNLGNALQDHGKLEEAITEYRQAIRLNPDDATAYNNLGNALQDHGKLEEAITEYRQAIRLNPDDATAYNNLGIALKAHGKLEEAITEYRQAIRINPDYAMAYNNLGIALQDHGKLEEAITEYRQAIRINPDYATAYYNLGNALQDHGKLEEAITEYRQAIRLNPDYATAYYNLGIALKAHGKLEEAITEYRQAIRLNPDYATAYDRLGWVYLLQGNWVQAQENFEDAMHHAPNHYNCVLNLGLVYALQGNVEAAKTHWQHGVALCQGEDDWDRATRALYTLALGEAERGQAEMQTLIQSNPRSVALKNALEDAEILARCPVRPDGIDQVVELLRQAISPAD